MSEIQEQLCKYTPEQRTAILLEASIRSSNASALTPQDEAFAAGVAESLAKGEKPDYSYLDRMEKTEPFPILPHLRDVLDELKNPDSGMTIEGVVKNFRAIDSEVSALHGMKSIFGKLREERGEWMPDRGCER